MLQVCPEHSSLTVIEARSLQITLSACNRENKGFYRTYSRNK
jgi:hypothetical protein